MLRGARAADRFVEGWAPVAARDLERRPQQRLYRFEPGRQALQVLDDLGRGGIVYASLLGGLRVGQGAQGKIRGQLHAGSLERFSEQGLPLPEKGGSKRLPGVIQ